MKLENLKNESPVMPEHMRKMVEQEVNKQMRTESEKKHRAWGRMSWRKSAVIAFAATLALSTTVFGGVKLYQWHMEKEGNYGLKAGITADDTMQSADAVAVPEEIPCLSIEPGYLPEGMVTADDGSEKYFYESNPWKGGFSIGVVAMDAELSTDQLPVSDTSVTASEMVTINGMDGIYLEKEGSDFNKKLYIAYPEYWQILEIYVGNDVTKEEALKMAENLDVKPTGEMRARSDGYTWSEMLTQEVDTTQMQVTASKDEMKNLHQVGEAFEISEEPLQIKVADVQISDDLSLLGDEYTDTDLSQAADSTGKLVKNEISYIKTGDGIDSIDEVIQTEEVNQKLVYVTAEYTNTGDEELTDVLFFGSFLGMTETDDGYVMYDRALADDNDATDAIAASSMGGFGEMDYYDIHSGERSNNYIPSIQPGETVTVHIGKVVNEDELDKMYLSLDTSGAAYEFTEQGLQTGYVDIRK